MTNLNDRQREAINQFRDLHASGCFLLPNPFDIGTAVYLYQLGFKALATSSAGFAFTRGLPDDVASIPVDLMLEHIRDIVNATPLPVNADFQNGYADHAEDVAENVKRCVATGVAGLSIEDNSGRQEQPLYEEVQAVERIKAARKAIDQSGRNVILTARCEAWLVAHPNAFEVAVKRLVAFADAGADCLYAPGVTDATEISAIVKSVAPKPVNVLVSRPDPNLSLARLTDLGVRRISVGSALSRVAWAAFIHSAQQIIDTGQFDSFADLASFAELNAIFRNRN
jgi:2-methylisocitrate lyase-like PEP mutase family enzyme